MSQLRTTPRHGFGKPGEVRRAEMEALIAQRVPRDEMAVRMGITVGRLQRLAEQLGLCLPWKTRKPKRVAE